MTELWSQFTQHLNSAGSRTDVLRALVWPNAGLLAALIIAGAKGEPTFILVLLSILLVIFMLLYAGAYIAFGKRDPNLLRSERFNIERMAIEAGLYGDSHMGLRDPAGLALPPSATAALPKPQTGDDAG